MATGFITKRAVDACKPGERQFVLWDDGKEAVKGFGLLVMPSGVRSYIFQFRIGGRAGRTRRYTIGKHGSPWTPESARKHAGELASQVRVGIDPVDAKRAELNARECAKVSEREEARRAQALAFRAYSERFLQEARKRKGEPMRPRTIESYRHAFACHVSPDLGNTPLPAITFADVRRVIDAIPVDQPSVRRIVFAALNRLFNWAVSRRELVVSPMAGMEAPSAVASRDRVLSDRELALVLRAAGTMEAPFGPLYLLLFATGQRREEVARLDWAELDRAHATWTLPGARAKNGEASLIPLNRHALAALDSMAGFEATQAQEWPRKGLIFTSTGKTSVSGYSRAKARLDALMQRIAQEDAAEAGNGVDCVSFASWRLHDARRTLATALQRLGVRFEVTEAVLNHVSGASRSGVAGVYQRHSWGPEKRAALDAWADHCDRLLSPTADAGNVVALRTAGG